MLERQTNFSWPLVGNEPIKDYLAKVILSGNLSGSYVFSGPDNLGKTTTALHFSRILLCQEEKTKRAVLPCGHCPACRQFSGGADGLFGEDSRHGDFHLVKKDKDKKNISIAQIRELNKILGLSSFLNANKIGVIKHAEYLSEDAANALLKTMEEPRANVLIILITSAPDSLPRTIISRSQVVEFKPVPAARLYDYLVQEKKAPRSQALIFSRLAAGRPALASKFFEDEDFYLLYRQRINVLLSFFPADLNSRFNMIDSLFQDVPKGQEQVRTAERILDGWQGVLRDALLWHFGEKDLIQHEPCQEEIAALVGRFAPAAILSWQKAIRAGREYLRANVSPKTVLENLAVNFL